MYTLLFNIYLLINMYIINWNHKSLSISMIHKQLTKHFKVNHGSIFIVNYKLHGVDINVI